MELLRFTTAGSVDDGKSTLIGRLLYDTKSIFEDQYEEIENSSKRRGEENVNLALLTDGLKAEREQGITIDVAYRYFATPKRKFIIADTPGHIQYTRNMVTGASTANLAIILVDARKGVSEQTKRHSFIASLLQIPHVVFAINKMDLIDYDEEKFEQIKEDITNFASKLEVKDIHFIPISALNGDNVVNQSEKMPWYKGSTLLYLLENLHLSSDHNHTDARFPVQNVIRPQSEKYHDYRSFAGRIAGGVFRKGEEVIVYPSGFTSRIKAIDTFNGEIDEAYAPMSVSFQLEDEIDISRGDLIAKPNNSPTASQDIDLMVSWLGDTPLNPSAKYLVKHTTSDVRAIVKEIKYKIDISTLDKNFEDKSIGTNDIARIRIRTTKPLFFDKYSRNRISGSLIIIDEATNVTVGAGMII